MIVPDLHRHDCLLVVSHGITLFALVKHGTFGTNGVGTFRWSLQQCR